MQTISDLINRLQALGDEIGMEAAVEPGLHGYGLALNVERDWTRGGRMVLVQIASSPEELTELDHRAAHGLF